MVIRLHSRTSAAFLAADLKQARVDAVTAAANQAFVERIPVPSCTPARLLLLTAHSTHTDRVGFEPTVPLRAHRFSRPAVSTAHAPVQGSHICRRLRALRGSHPADLPRRSPPCGTTSG